ncbi:hypothetical protein MRX96_002995 [Rhipicephalus microplus]
MSNHMERSGDVSWHAPSQILVCYAGSLSTTRQRSSKIPASLFLFGVDEADCRKDLRDKRKRCYPLDHGAADRPTKRRL